MFKMLSIICYIYNFLEITVYTNKWETNKQLLFVLTLVKILHHNWHDKDLGLFNIKDYI